MSLHLPTYLPPSLTPRLPLPLQVVTTSASQMSAQQLERFTAEYSNLAAAAEQAGLAVDQQLKQVGGCGGSEGGGEGGGGGEGEGA